ncbi:hypothetical protein ACEPAF_8902 [Sanghuangporus sanghuang]|uniref:ATPase inhibitor, mitochondrial n=1 Tax=Sanghuangporus baumii TaxID=108892 RepID=A0A9Q5HY01_SANBA|nr:hypothetical protein A7U60_g4954 [Sanghuangporus baumii]
MLSSRTASSIRRGAQASSFARMAATPQFTRSMTYVYNEGAVAQSKEFSKKERAHEDQFVKQHEMEQLKRLRADIEKKRAELESLEKEHAEKLEQVSNGKE